MERNGFFNLINDVNNSIANVKKKTTVISVQFVYKVRFAGNFQYF